MHFHLDWQTLNENMVCTDQESEKTDNSSNINQQINYEYFQNLHLKKKYLCPK